MVREICSPITRRGSRASGHIPGSSPGARTHPTARGRDDNTWGGQYPAPSLPMSGISGQPTVAPNADQPTEIRKTDQPAETRKTGPEPNGT
jgi:hypothetical protein